tara:strand:+ start:125 stop:487 length:363 start_codon:yes stop_codon:yes gene_type:complete
MQNNDQEFIPSSSIKIISRANSISSLDTFASSAKSDDSLFEIWENRKLSDEKQKPTLTTSIPIKKSTHYRVREQTIDLSLSKTPDVGDALHILQQTKNIIQKLGFNLDNSGTMLRRTLSE